MLFGTHETKNMQLTMVSYVMEKMTMVGSMFSSFYLCNNVF